MSTSSVFIFTLYNNYDTDYRRCVNGSVLDHISLPPEFESRPGHI